MIIVFDIGNTNIKMGLFKGDELVETLRMASSNKTSDEYWVLIKDLLSLKKLSTKDIQGAIMCSVNPTLNYTFEHMIEVYFGITPIMVSAEVKTGLKICYDNPSEIGADRIAGCAAAYSIYGGPIIVIDCGTATTFNVVTKAGELKGGAISFGLKAAADSLSHEAARLPKVELAIPDKAIGTTTITNMQSGVIFGYSGMVESMVNRIKKEFGNAKVIATGGISDIVNSCVNAIDVVDRTLTLRGLNIIYNLNK